MTSDEFPWGLVSERQREQAERWTRKILSFPPHDAPYHRELAMQDEDLIVTVRVAHGGGSAEVRITPAGMVFSTATGRIVPGLA